MQENCFLGVSAAVKSLSRLPDYFAAVMVFT